MFGAAGGLEESATCGWVRECVGPCCQLGCFRLGYRCCRSGFWCCHSGNGYCQLPWREKKLSHSEKYHNTISRPGCNYSCLLYYSGALKLEICEKTLCSIALYWWGIPAESRQYIPAKEKGLKIKKSSEKLNCLVKHCCIVCKCTKLSRRNFISNSGWAQKILEESGLHDVLPKMRMKEYYVYMMYDPRSR